MATAQRAEDEIAELNVISVVVCFNPDVKRVSELCKELLASGSDVVLVDNTESSDLGQVASPGCELIATGENNGIAYAQNIGIRRAAGSGADAIALLARAAQLRKDSAETWTLLARAHLATGDKPAAANALREALEADPKNWIIHKQIWAIQHPERFYEGPVDFAWQREQLRREARKGG